MLSREDHLLAVLAEECNEVSKNVMKALRFGLMTREPGQDKTNAERISEELADLHAVKEMLESEKILKSAWPPGAMQRKKDKVEKYLTVAVENYFKLATEMIGSCTETNERIRALEEAIKTHRSQKADDRCIEDDDRLYAALGDGIPCDRRVGDKAAMLKNCERFIVRRTEGGTWPTYAELEARLAEAEAKLREKP